MLINSQLLKNCTFALLAGIIFICSCTSQPAKQPNIQAPDSSPAVAASSKPVDTNAVAQPAAKNKKQVAAHQLIVPGKSIGLTHIGEDMTKVLQRLGRPDAGDAAMGRSMSFWYAGHDSTGYKTAVFAGRAMGSADENISRVQQILITSPYFKTADDIHTGSSYRQAEVKYNLKKVTTFGKGDQKLTVYDDKSRGIAFEFDNERLCKGIIIHAQGKDGGVAYLSFHPELTPPNPPRGGGL